MSSFVLIAIALAMEATTISTAQAAWAPNGVALSSNASNYKPVIVPDGATGSIIAWYGGAGSDIFARRVLADGSIAPGWPASLPLVVCGATGLQEQPVLVADGTGGALVFWQDARGGSNYDIYGQHITGAGLVMAGPNSNWIPNGIAISTSGGNEYQPQAVSDQAGGAILVWQDAGTGAQGNYDIYAQRVDADGNLMWGPAGVAVCVAAGNQINPMIVGDGSGGAYVAWQDYRKGNEYDIYVQHLTADGNAFPDTRWANNGLGVCVAANSQFYPVVTQDGTGGVFVAWQDYRSGSDNHIFAQHLTAQGAIVGGWPVNGTPVCQAQYSQYYPVLTGDGTNGVFIAWQDYRDGATNHIYGQHLTSGNTSWTTDGIAVTTASNGQFAPQIAQDGAGGAFIAWYDSRNGSTNDIFVHEVSQTGVLNPNWDRNGLPVCTAPNTQQFPVLAKSTLGTAVMTWQDLRAGDLTTAAIFAQTTATLNPTGVGDHASGGGGLKLSAPRPNPSRGTTGLWLTLSAPTGVSVEVLDVAGRHVATLASGMLPAGVHDLTWNGTTDRGGRVAAGVYLVRVQGPGFDRTQRIVRLK
jgi:hypothetical protein